MSPSTSPVVADIFLNTFVGAEVTCFCQFSQGHQEVIKRLALLLHTLPEVAALDRLIELSSNILLDRRYDLVDAPTLGYCHAEVVYNSDRLPGKAQGEGLYSTTHEQLYTLVRESRE